MYIHQHKNWPAFNWEEKGLLNQLSTVRNLQGKLLGKMEAIGFRLRNEAMLQALTTDVIKSNQIEGENLDKEQVRSSVARHLGMDISGLTPPDRKVEGIVEMMLDATQNHTGPLTRERLFNWHAALFPTGRSGIHKIIVADWRNDESGPMQVVSGPMGKETVHYEAPAAKRLDKEMNKFLQWFNHDKEIEPVIKSGLAHFWFVTIHPFDDGNGRIARAIADMQLARAEQTNQRFYSVSAQLEKQKKEYYGILEQTQTMNANGAQNAMDLTPWLRWYLECVTDALVSTEDVLEKVLAKARFWETHASAILNVRQRHMINKLLDDFYGKLTTSKWAKMNKCSQDTALRDIQGLLDKGILIKEPGGGRSTSYRLKVH